MNGWISSLPRHFQHTCTFTSLAPSLKRKGNYNTKVLATYTAACIQLLVGKLDILFKCTENGPLLGNAVARYRLFKSTFKIPHLSIKHTSPGALLPTQQHRGLLWSSLLPGCAASSLQFLSSQLKSLSSIRATF